MMFGLFGFDDSFVGEKIPENSVRAVESLFSRHYNVLKVKKDHWGDNRYLVCLADGRYLNVKTATGYTLMNQPYTYIHSIISLTER